MTTLRPAKIEGYTATEISALEDLRALVITGAPIAFKVGGADILAQFSVSGSTLIAELGVAEGGEEQTLFTLVHAIERAARHQGVGAIDWCVYAADCPIPNAKLVRVLEKLRFERTTLETTGAVVYRGRTSTNDTVLRRP